MAHNRTTQYSAPFKRNSLLSLHQYAASEHFPSLGCWDRARMEDLYVVKGTVGRSQPVHIMIVGVISSDKAHLMPHGNYDPTYMPVENVGKKAKLQFVIASPADDPDFASDYETAVERLLAVQEEVSGSPTRREHFIEGGNLKLNFYLFSEKDADEIEREASGNESEAVDSDVEDVKPMSQTPAQEPYEVQSSYRYTWDVVGKNYDNNIMQVYGVDEQLVDYRLFPKHLAPGTTVLVTFTLKHFGIREKGSPKIISDTFNACIESVSILKEAAKKVKSTPSSTPKRRPLPVSQIPSRATQKLSSDTFSPVKVRTEPSFAATYRASRRQIETSAGSSSVSKKDVVVDAQQAVSAAPSALDVNLQALRREIMDEMLPFMSMVDSVAKRMEAASGRAPRTPSPDRSSSSTISTISAGSVPEPASGVIEPTPVVAPTTSFVTAGSAGDALLKDADDLSEDTHASKRSVDHSSTADDVVGGSEMEEDSYEVINVDKSDLNVGETGTGVTSATAIPVSKGKGAGTQDKKESKRRRG